MRKILLGAAALIAIAAPGVAAAQTSGTVTLGYGVLDDDDDGSKDAVLSLDGSLVGTLSGAWQGQLNANFTTMEHGNHDDPFSSTTGHIFHRDGAMAFGGFAGFENVAGSTRYHLGLEGAIYLPNITLNAAYTFLDSYNSTGSNEGSALDVTGDFFLSPNTSIGANVGWTDDDYWGSDGFNYGVNIEHQFAGSPFSIGAAYTIADLDYSGGGGHEVSRFGIFGRINFGTGSLQERSQHGASMIGGQSAVRNSINNW